jgi:HEAT repeat protein
MKKGSPSLVFALGLFLSIGSAAAQTPILISYERNFLRANLPDKENILRDAATDDRAAEFIGPLYEYALNFSLQNVEILGDDPDMISLTVFAARELGRTGYKDGVETLRLIFAVYPDSVVRVAALNSLAVLGKGHPDLAEELNLYLASQHSRYRSGMAPDYPVLSACIAALGSLGDSGSFPPLFDALTAGYPGSVVATASAALETVQGDYTGFLIGVVQQEPPPEKLIAFNAGIKGRTLTDVQKGELAEKALEASLDLSPASGEDAGAAADLRYAAALALGELRWTRAAGLLIRHFYQVQRDYGNGLASRDRFLEAISCLGSMSSSEAAQVLALQLGYFNSQMERTGEYDEAVSLGVIQSLGEIGDKIAFDYLLYISYLSYPESVKSAARTAMARLKW